MATKTCTVSWDNHAMRLESRFFLSLSAKAIIPQSNPKPFDNGSKTAFEAVVRYYDLLVPEVMVKIADLKPSKSLPGHSEIGVHLSYQGNGRDEVYYLSADGLRPSSPQSPVPFRRSTLKAIRLRSTSTSSFVDYFKPATDPPTRP